VSADTRPDVPYRDIVACSFSGLRDISRSPAYARWRREHPDEQTPAMIRGSAFHCAVLESDAFDARYVLKDFDARTKDGKARRDELAAKGVVPLDVEMWDAVKRSADAVLLDPAAKPLLDSAKVREKPILWTSDGVDFKGIPDARGPGLVLDLKSTTNAHPDDFPRFIAGCRVDAQLALYAWGASHPEPSDDVEKFAIAVTDDAPHEVYVFEFDDAIIARAWEWLTPLIALWKECVARGAWPAGPGAILPARLAPWDRQHDASVPEIDPLDVSF
jgi:exodeoxyribonuclease VIII